MIINTRDFGYVEIAPEDIITFPEGIYGFEDVREFVILKLEEDDDGSIFCLQAVHDEYPRVVLVNPNVVDKGYKPDISDEVLKKLEAASRTALCFFAVAVIPQDIRHMTVNLKSPVVVNLERKLAMQVVLDNPNYEIRHKIFDRNEGVG